MNAPLRLRAPRQDRAILAEPPLEAAGALVASNRKALTLPSLSVAGTPLGELRSRARLSALAAAQDYFRRRGEPLPLINDSSLVMAGHQPELFHPGVWVKNFALQKIAHSQHATAVNLLVDNDTVKTSLLRLPSAQGPKGLFRMASVTLDRWQGEAPYEERQVLDQEMFESVPERVAPLIRSWNFRPMLKEFWQDVRAQAHPLLGERLAAARRVWERRWGCHNLELPISRLCQTEPFDWFAWHLLTELPRFHTIYNDVVHAYRQRYGLRSLKHPVPDLARDGDWLEAPFWAWRTGAARRGRLFVRTVNGQIELRAGPDPWPSVSTQHSALSTLESQGLKLRSRALTNTLYARVFLADLFIHGIGGGKYDELTDAIIRRFYGFEPPRFLVLSATLLLPLPHLPASADSCKRLARELRDLHWNPQRHLEDHDAGALELAREKQTWIARQPQDRRTYRERYLTLRRLSSQLQPYVAEREMRLEQELLRCEEQVASNQVVTRRDYAFCLYPAAELREFCQRFL